MLTGKKCREWDKFMKMSIWDEDTHGWIASPAVGLSGGLLISWISNAIEYLTHVQRRNWIHFTGKFLSTGSLFTIFNVYARANTTEKKDL